MSRRQLLLIGSLVLALLGLSGWMIFRGVHLSQNSFLTGRPPEDMLQALIPQNIDLAKMHPPAVRPSDPARYGNATSSANVILFADFECPTCLQLEQTLNTVIPAYNGKVRLVWRDFPMKDIHSSAMEAAILARCANTQGQFWQAHDALFQHASLNALTLHAISTQLRLNTAGLDTCKNDPKIQQAIEQDIKAAEADGIHSVPFLFIGTKAVNGMVTPEQLKKELDQFLKS